MDYLVSIITPFYNNEETLENTVNSILQQTYSNWELILINDASTDASFQIAKKLELGDSRIKVYTNTVNEGAAKSRNLGISLAKGAIIAFLDADDLWYARKLEVQLKHFNNYDVCFSSYDLMSESGTLQMKTVMAHPELTLAQLLKANYIGNLTGMYNASRLGKIYTKNLRKRQDWLLWILALKASGKPAYGVQQSLAAYRVRKTSLSSNKLSLVKYNYQVFRIGLEYSFVKSIYCTLRFLIEQIFVKPRRVHIKTDV